VSPSQQAEQISNADRQYWMSLLSRSNASELKTYWDELSLDYSFTHLRKPEIGLVMVRARAGGKGQRFNLGEASVTRCSVKLETGEIGHSYVTGRNKAHAELAAVFDALLQNEQMNDRLKACVITPIAQRLKEERRIREEKVASTKVDFFTMVRGEDE
jgi:alpha-D-ribose 1-methylphosphonate 5-triphosphate synthase subunit PhnG